ncbi:ATP phosphoribosyltransferase regulatory subunit [Pseudoruegeria aquimaris]|uniref:Histidine--tRNA ligase n=1 Tax=Pseudoruegeria aquimaris TaxID=393663 RepID=A0A1Y5SRR2_9RHOB|nr:ATP phosphoribosyltransferase regulatory subunit [Pseudoruegeria aquimaris]SLN45053.1 ATP phosphoribosyltransferase regulatory subunit [Pseudoruegeria aquimaris]
MSIKPEARAEALRLRAFFEAAGARPVEADILQPAETLLDLYGEDIRARAYVTSDPLRGERMLRPDFTVPVVQMHMADGAEPARYTYAGEVFRRQEHDAGRPSEYLQVGYEVFDGSDPAAADAEVFALFLDVLSPLGLRAATGDIGVLKAAVLGLSTTERRKQALLRHIWRPRRFRALLDRFGGKVPVPAARKALLAALERGEDVFAKAGPENGLRSRAEVEARLAALREDAAQPPIAAGEVEVLNDILSLKEKMPNVVANLGDIAVDLPALLPAVERLERRMEALAARGVAVEALDFETSYGRTQMEYYDGFVFGFYADGRADLPPVATGGRYDALTEVLGRGTSIPAVGGVIRPEIVSLLRGGAA